MAKLTRRPPRQCRKRTSARAPKIMHPHAYADSTHVKPAMVALQSQALESMPKPVPQHVLEAGNQAARRRRLPLAHRLSEATVVQSAFDLHHQHHPDYASMTSFSPASTVVDGTRSGSITPDRETSRSFARQSSRRKSENTIDAPVQEMAFYRRFVVLWKRVSRIVRKIARVGSKRSTHAETWLPTGFVLVEPWWRRSGVASRASRRSSSFRYSSLFGRHAAQN